MHNFCQSSSPKFSVGCVLLTAHFNRVNPMVIAWPQTSVLHQLAITENWDIETDNGSRLVFISNVITFDTFFLVDIDRRAYGNWKWWKLVKSKHLNLKLDWKPDGMLRPKQVPVPFFPFENFGFTKMSTKRPWTAQVNAPRANRTYETKF